MNGILNDKRYKENRIVERAVDICYEISEYQVNPYNFLYHNPNSIRTVQYFAHWTQKWTNRCAYIAVLQAAKVGGYEVVPAVLTYRNAKRDGLKERGVRVGNLRFYMIKRDEMAKGLLRRYDKYRKLLSAQLKKHNDDRPTAEELAEKKANR